MITLSWPSMNPFTNDNVLLLEHADRANCVSIKSINWVVFKESLIKIKKDKREKI